MRWFSAGVLPGAGGGVWWWKTRLSACLPACLPKTCLPACVMPLTYSPAHLRVELGQLWGGGGGSWASCIVPLVRGSPYITADVVGLKPLFRGSGSLPGDATVGPATSFKLTVCFSPYPVTTHVLYFSKPVTLIYKNYQVGNDNFYKVCVGKGGGARVEIEGGWLGGQDPTPHTACRHPLPAPFIPPPSACLQVTTSAPFTGTLRYAGLLDSTCRWECAC